VTGVSVPHDAEWHAFWLSLPGRQPQPLPAPVITGPEPTPAPEEPMSSPVTAALAAVQHQAAVLEADVAANPLAVLVTARHVGKTFTEAERVAVTDFIAALEAEKRAQAAGRPPAVRDVPQPPAANGSRLTGPQQQVTA